MLDDIVEKVVVVVDLSRSTDISNHLEQQLDVRAVATFKDQIKNLLKIAMAATRIQPECVPPCENTGDGAIIVLDKSIEASHFAECLHRAAEDYNSERNVPLAQRHFRIGIWPGKILLRPHSHGMGCQTTFDFVGTAISNAVRLEGACKTGEVLIGYEAWLDLPPDIRRLYGVEEIVYGKRNEEFRVHRRRVVGPAPWDICHSMSSPQNTTSLKNFEAKLTAIATRRLEILLSQRERFGPLFTPPYILMEIEDLERNLFKGCEHPFSL